MLLTLRSIISNVFFEDSIINKDYCEPYLIHRPKRLAFKKKKRRRKVGVFEFWKIRPPGETILFGVATYFLFLFFLNGENKVRTKTPH